MAKTIGQLGILEPLIVRASQTYHEQFEIVAGERRFRAAKLAGLAVVPCLLSNYTNEQAAQIALIENTCREALNPIAEAIAIRRLADEFKYTHDEISVLLGVSRPHVSNLLRLLNLDARIQHWMKQGHLSEGHGKILASLPYEKQYWFAYEAIKTEWSVRTLDEAIKVSDNKKSSRDTDKAKHFNPIELKLQEQLGFPIKIMGKKTKEDTFASHSIIRKLCLKY
ncbi:MAG: ParB/RepB/Spo0J family partition protein [Gammaproteobacteria bacterium]